MAARKRKATTKRRKRTTTGKRKKRGGTIPLPVLKKRLKRLEAIVKRRDR